MLGGEEFENFRVYVLRYEDRREWLAKAKSGDEAASVCQWAASRWINAISTEYSACSCCDTAISTSDDIRAFVVLIPIKQDPENAQAKASGVCSECSKHDNRWIIDQTTRSGGLSQATRRPGDQIH